MNAFLSSTIEDIRTGRQSWRVYLALCIPSFGISTAACLVRHIL